MQVAQKLGLEYREGFYKNRYVGRTFIMPGQAERKKSVRQKLNALGTEFAGKNVLIVDDSIVRGTTSREIVQMARLAGANKVTFTSAAPPVRFPNVYGINMPTRAELLAHGRSEEKSPRFLEPTMWCIRPLKIYWPASLKTPRSRILRCPVSMVIT